MKFSCLIFFALLPLVISAQDIEIARDTSVATTHSTLIRGRKIDYTAITGTQPVWSDSGRVIASLHYTYYRRNNTGPLSERPLLISFNGGPGSASVWMHIAYTGPKVLNIDSEGYPVQPYGVKNNENSVLDIADIVYVNPVNTGYSRMIPSSGKGLKRETFFGVNADIKYLAGWLTTFVTRHNRWLSPKFLIGESYGGTRVSGLALELQEKQWMYLNGVILVSPAEYRLAESDPALSSALKLPYFAAAAWYHKMLPQDLQQRDLLEVLPEVEQFALDQLMPALARGGSLSQADKQAIAEKMSRYSGLSSQSIMEHNLNVPAQFFWKDLMRDQSGHTIGRLDSRYLGMDKMLAGDQPDFNPELNSWLHSFTPAINYYFSQELNFKTDAKYQMFGDVHPWDRQNNNTRDNLRKAMAQNPYLKLFFQAGYYDGGTTYFSTKYKMWQMDPEGRLQERMHFKGYRSGHMMYLRKEDLKSANNDLREFIGSALPKENPAKY